MKRNCLFIFLLALAIRIVIVFINIIPEAPDSPTYYRIAYSLIKGQGYSYEGIPTGAREPTYPIFLASIFLIFGKNLFLVKIIQAILNALCALVIYAIIKGISGEKRYGILGGIIFAINPSLFIQPSYIVTEPLVIFIIIFHIFFVYKLFFTQKKIPYLLLSGISMSLLVLIKSITFLLPIFEAIIVLKAIRRPKIAFLFLVSSYFLVSFWIGRNMVIFNDKNLFRALRRATNSILLWECVQIKPVWPVAEIEWSHLKKKEEIIFAQYGLKEGERYLVQDSIRIFTENPFGVIKNVLKLSLYSFIEANGAYMLSKKNRFGGFVVRLWHWLMLIFSFIGIIFFLVKLNNLKRLYFLFLFGICLYFIILLIPCFPIPRYYVPILPILNIFASFGLGLVFKKCNVWNLWDI